MRSKPSPISVSLLLAFAALAARGEGVLLNGTAATVGKTLITVQDAYFYRSLNRLIAGEGKVLEPESGDDLRRTVQKMAFEEMVHQEMKSMQFEAGPRRHAEDSLRKVRSERSGPWRAVLKTYGRTEAQAIEVVHRTIQVERFLQKKVETLTPIVTLKEVELYFNQNRDRFKGSDFDTLKPSIEVLLKKERMRKGLEEWIRFLRDKYGIVNYLAG